MQHRMIALMLVFAVAFVGLAGPAQAEETGALVVRKLFRGIANTATGWMEIPKQMSITWQEEGPGVGSTWGFFKGLGMAVARTAAGAFEIVTFPLPIPDRYDPIMQPEYVLDDIPA